MHKKLLSGLMPILLAASIASAQEPLINMVDRGYVADWVFCGPFTADADGGIITALEQSASPLGARDYLESMGGVSRARPRAGSAVTGPDGAFTWNALQADSELLDLTETFKDQREGVMYFAFSCYNPLQATVYIDLQTPLGARMWINGFPAVDIQPASFENAGVNRFLARVRSGENWIIIEAPFASFPALAQATGIPEDRLRARGFPNRPLLPANSSFEIAMRILPVRAIGDVAYIPILEPQRSFSDENGVLKQGALLTFFNPGKEASFPISIQTTVQGQSPSPEQVVLPIPPQTQYEALLAIPLGSAAPGQTLDIKVLLTTKRNQEEFTAPLAAGQPPTKGHVYVVPGATYHPGYPEEQREAMARRLAELDQQMALAGAERDYGFYLGDLPYWKSYLATRETAREALPALAAAGRSAPQAGYGMLDERIVGGELLARNWAYGRIAAERLLGSGGGCYYAWDVPAICPQTPQLLAKSNISGILTDLPVQGVAPLFWQVSPDKTRLLMRRKQPAPGPGSVDTLRQMADVQRRQLLQMGLDTDVFAPISSEPPPEPYYLGACHPLRIGVPSITVEGSGGAAFFEETLAAVRRGGVHLPYSGRMLNTSQPGALLSQPALKRAHGLVENKVITAEKLATLAALVGAPYPETQLDHAWRQLLYTGSPDRLGFPGAPRIYCDALSSYRRAAADAHRAAANAMDYIAQRINTQSSAPKEPKPSQALVVFNPCSWMRTDVCRAAVAIDANAGLILMDENANTVPYAIAEAPEPPSTMALIEFVASDVPPLGYRTYYAAPAGALPPNTEASGASIENESLRVLLNPEEGGGAISLLYKPTGREFASKLMNDVAAIEEDPQRTNGGRDLWTTSRITRTSDVPGDITVMKNEIFERATISAPLAGGVAIREMTLYKGVPRVDCTLRCSGISVQNALLAILSGCFSVGDVAVFGERYGASVGRKSASIMDLRTAGADNPSATAAQPAYEWSALTPGDYLRFSEEIAVPFGPADIIYGEGEAFVRSAEMLVEALASRGIPSAILPESGPQKSAVWSDSTEFENLDDDLRYGAAFRIVLGNGGDTKLCARLVATLPESVARDFNQHAPEGALLLLQDPQVPEGIPPVPTLLLSGSTPAVTQKLAETVATALKASGWVPGSKWEYAGSNNAPLADGGIAMLHAGSALHNISQNGVMMLGLAHGSTWENAADALDLDPAADFTFNYSIYPFLGDWRKGGVVRQAQAFNEPLLAAVTGIHPGTLPLRQAFLSVSGQEFIITAVKPSGYPSARMSVHPLPPRAGFTIRGYETTGQDWTGTLQALSPITRAAQRSLLEDGGQSLAPNGRDLTFTARGFSIETLTIALEGLPVAPGSSSMPPEKPQPPVYSRYWLHNTGAAPEGFEDISILLEGDLSKAGSPVSIMVANNTTDASIDGSVSLSASTGWTISPELFSYHLEPGGVTTQKLVVLRSTGEDTQSGGIIAETSYAGRTYRDVLELNPRECILFAALEGDTVNATVSNPGVLPAEGSIELIVPPEWWPELSGKGPSEPVQTRVKVAPQGTQSIPFSLPPGDAPPWIIVKLAANGHVAYTKVEPFPGLLPLE